MGELREGQTGTAADGTRVIVRNGQIVPLSQAQPQQNALAPHGDPAGTTRLPNGTLLSAPGPRGGAPKPLMGLGVQEQIQLATMRNRAGAQRTDLADSERFSRLAEEQGTGGIFGLPGVGGLAAGVAGAYNPRVDEMNEINARLTPAQRQSGAGATSDADLRLYGRAVPGIGHTADANEAIINRGRARAGESQLQSEFYDQYASQHGTLQGALQAWNDIYRPPPVESGSPEPRANVRPTDAQRHAIETLPGRRREAPLGSRENPRVPPPTYDTNHLPRGDWFVDPQGQVRQVGAPRTQGGHVRRYNPATGRIE